MKARAVAAATAGAGATALSTAAGVCCVPLLAPLSISVLGVGGAVWVAGLQPFSLTILAAAGLLLAWGFWNAYRPSPRALRGCRSSETCGVGRSRWPRVLLWLSASVWLLALGLQVLQRTGFWEGA